MTKTVQNITHWFFFVFIMSLLPIIVNLLMLIDNISYNELTRCYFETISKGQMILISAILLGQSIGDVIQGETRYIALRNILIGISIILLFIFIFSYTKIETFTEEKNKQISLIALIGMFLVTLSSSLFPKDS